MKNNKHRVLIAVIFPVVCLLALSVYKHIKIHTGKTIIIPVTGYDPRDLLSGHYLTYRLDIEYGDSCTANTDEEIYLCLDKKENGNVEGFRVDDPEEALSNGCEIFIKGRCDYSRFIAGIERFYIPEEHAEVLDRVMRNEKCSLVVKIDSEGNASIKDMLINDKPWREFIKR